MFIVSFSNTSDFYTLPRKSCWLYTLQRKMKFLTLLWNHVDYMYRLYLCRFFSLCRRVGYWFLRCEKAGTTQLFFFFRFLDIKEPEWLHYIHLDSLKWNDLNIVMSSICTEPFIRPNHDIFSIHYSVYLVLTIAYLCMTLHYCIKKLTCFICALCRSLGSMWGLPLLVCLSYGTPMAPSLE